MFVSFRFLVQAACLLRIILVIDANALWKQIDDESCQYGIIMQTRPLRQFRRYVDVS